MHHYALRAQEGRLLFRDWIEAHALWRAFVERGAFIALVLMPNHVHALVPDASQSVALQRATRAFARWRNARRGESGAAWVHRDVPKIIDGAKYERRSLHYAYLNPCRAGLVDDPLAWPFSSYRDAMGVAVPALGAPARDPESLHARLTATLSTTRRVAPLPRVQLGGSRPDARRVMGAVSSLTRTPPGLMRRPGTTRRLMVRAAREFAGASSEEIAALLGLNAATVRNGWREPVRGLGLVKRVLADARFGILVEGDLRRLSAWRRYAELT